MEIDYGTSACNFNMGYWSSSNNERQQYYGKESVVMCDVDDVLSSSFPATTTSQLHQPPSASSLDNYSVNDVPILEEMFLLNVDPFSLSPDLVVPSGFWNELMKTEEQLNQLLLLGSNNNPSSDHTADDKGNYKMKAAPKKKRRPRRGAHAKTTIRGVSINNKTKKLSREMISHYFCMPIIKAARELKVGLTLLKKRCRELGIRRWPHRKINSIQTLIKNVQELETSNGEEMILTRSDLEKLEQEKKLLEEIDPDMELDHTTKRMRQAFFKANYKKRKLMNNMGSAVVLVDSHSIQSSTASPTTPTAINANHENDIAVNFCDDDDSEDEELKYLLDDCFSSCNLY